MSKPIKSVLVGLGVALFGAGLGLTPLGVEFEQDFGLAWLFNMRGAIAPPEEVAVIAMDSNTGARVSENTAGSLGVLPRDWPRTVHGGLLDRLVELGAVTVVFDLDFSRAKQSRDDLAFADAILRSARVILFERLTGKRQPLIGADGRPTGFVWIERAVAPVEAFVDSARAVGPFPLPKLDEALYQYWAFKPSAGNVPTMPAIALQLFNAERLRALPGRLDLSAAPAAVKLLTQAPATAEDFQRHMVDARNLFETDPTVAPSIRRWVAGATTNELPSAHRPMLSALAALYAGGSSRYLNFYGPPGTVNTYSYQNILSREVSPDLQGTAVFVGYSDLFDPGQPDRFYTVFTRRSDGVDLSGVEIAATAFGNLLTDHGVEPVTFAQTAGILLVFGLVLGAFLYTFTAIWAVPCALIGVGGYAATAQWIFEQEAIWVPLAIPLLVQFPTALVVGLLGQYLWERRQKERFSDAVSYYVPESVVRQLVEEGVDAQGANRVLYAACLATDMAGFTTLGERMAAGELATFMNDYFEALAAPLKQQGVDVTEFRADAIMCAWTADAEEVRVRQRSVYAALGAVDAVAEFGKHHQHALQCRIGLDVGWVYVGHAGGGGHFVYSIVGDSANTAARVESLNKQLGTQVLATQAAVEGIEDIILRPLGRFVFVGKQEPLGIFEILEHSDRASLELRTDVNEFAEALEAFEQQQWRVAEAGFEAYSNSKPDDGPARLYRDLAKEYSQTPPERDDPAVIILDQK
ncbi:MAG: adenylate cyclase [Gammaproteobacteria bacterium]|jgi:adenylate cyclase